MDQNWDSSSWIPSEDSLSSGRDTLPQDRLKYAIKRIQEITKDILDVPYLPMYWLFRGQYLLDIGYPELAAGDAYKAIMLCEAGLNPTAKPEDCALSHMVRFICAMHASAKGEFYEYCPKEVLVNVTYTAMEKARKTSYHVLIQSAWSIHNFVDAIKICNKARLLYPEDDSFRTRLPLIQKQFDDHAKLCKSRGLDFTEQKQRASFGFVWQRTYPWIPTSASTRSKAFIKKANKSLKKVSDCIEIRESKIAGTKEKGAELTCCGVFATRDIRKGEIFLQESHPFAVSIEQPATQCGNCFRSLAACVEVRHMDCCNIYKYCSKSCERIAREFYHSAICNKDFSSVINAAHQAYGGKDEGKGVVDGKTELERLTGWPDRLTNDYGESNFGFPGFIPVFLIRVLAMCLKSGCSPLEHPNIAPLMPNESAELFWSFEGMVKGPITVCQILGIDVWADLRFDTWVLLTAWARIKNNCSSYPGGFPNSSLSPSYSWFNHSCDPNSSMETATVTRYCELHMQAMRNIKAGEEICVTYLEPKQVKALPVPQRRALMRSWLDTDCMCSRCVKEASEAAT